MSRVTTGLLKLEEASRSEESAEGTSGRGTGFQDSEECSSRTDFFQFLTPCLLKPEPLCRETHQYINVVVLKTGLWLNHLTLNFLCLKCFYQQMLQDDKNSNRLKKVNSPLQILTLGSLFKFIIH